MTVDIARRRRVQQQQFNQLVGLLEQFQVLGGNNTGNTAREAANNIMGGAVNFAGILACYSSITDIGKLSCEFYKLSVDSWIIDSGETHHMNFNKSLLTNIRLLRWLPYQMAIELE